VQTTFRFTERDASEFPRWSFQNIDLEYDPASGSVWMIYKEDGPPYYALQTLIDIATVRDSLRALMSSSYGRAFPVRYLVMASRKPGVFNLGGDLVMFAQSIRNQERETLRTYAHACVDLVYGLATAFDLPIMTVAVVTGQALGGGLEAALAQDFLIADETAKIGVPEVAFNTFPGMGAVSLLSRRLGDARAEDIISSGVIYTGKQMLDLNLVDILAPEGRSVQTALAWMCEGGPERFERRLAMANARRRFFPISHAELIKITDLWVDCSLDVRPQDLRHMERLAAAQKRMLTE
jgi:DSF synthase